MLVERDQALSQLSALLDVCTSGSGGVVVVRGPVATGKTKLLHYFAQHALAGGARFLNAAGSPAERYLPFGLMCQLMSSAGPNVPHLEQAAALLESYTVRQAADAVPAEVAPAVLNTIWRGFLAMATEEPLLIGVDDVCHADAQSLQCLLFIARRVHQVPILIVLTDQGRTSERNSYLRTELQRLPHCRQIRLEPLSSEGVAALLAHELDPHVAHSLATAVFSITGGNPLLTQALTDDWQVSARTGGLRQLSLMVVGDCFAESLVSCLYRCEPDVRLTAQAIAVIGEAAKPALVAELANVDVMEVHGIIELLNASGILLDGQYRHPVAQAAVVGDLCADRRTELHRRVARMIYADGGQPTLIARHLIAAGDSDEPWASSVLQESADTASARGEVDFALDCLKFAHSTASDENQRAVTRAILAQAEWKVDPARALRHVGQLTDAIQAGRLTGHQATAALEYLLWHGRVDTAVATLNRLATVTAETDQDILADFRDVYACLEVCYPMHRQYAPGGVMARLAVPPGQARSLVTTILEAAQGQFAADGEYLRQNFRLGDSSLAPIAAALLALSRPERLPMSAPWCVPMLEDAASRGSRIWQGLLLAVRADAALLQGDLPAAADLAVAALNEMTPGSWGVVVGAPLACLLTATTEMGRYDDAAAHLATPVPDSLLETPFGLRYLRSRGQYQLAVSRPYAALSDFQTCGELARTWEVDGANAIPWRIDAAQALLRLGRRAEARTLLDEHCAVFGADDQRTQGRALRQLAATVDLRERPRVLTEAVQALQQAGDQLELAHTLADLSYAYNTTGDSRRARLTMRRAWRVAKECQADGLSKALLPSLAGTSSMMPVAPLPAGEGAADLSAAEYQVGVLAAQGFTNRQIASKLSVTVSTVEQHLTRVFRKLKVKGRTDLPVYLQFDGVVAGEASGGISMVRR